MVYLEIKMGERVPNQPYDHEIHVLVFFNPRSAATFYCRANTRRTSLGAHAETHSCKYWRRRAIVPWSYLGR